jgi:uncharacterized protein (DUF697 family)
MGSYADTLDRILDGDFAEADAEERAEAVRQVIAACSAAAAAVAVQPFPLLDVALITPIQIAMVQAIGRVHGHDLDRKAVLEILTTLGASLVAQNAMMAAAKFIPLLGWVVGISMAFALTWSIGEVSDHYFLAGRGVEPSELRAMFRKVYAAKRAEKEVKHRGDRGLKRKLDLLDRMREEGMLDDEEYQARKEDLLADF